MTTPTEAEMLAAGWTRTGVGNWLRTPANGDPFGADMILQHATGGWFAWPGSGDAATHDTLAEAVAACDRARDGAA